MVSIKEIAHYGRWFPYCKTDYDLWWFDKKKSQMIDAEKLGVYLTAMFIRCRASLLNAMDTMFLAFV